jgi:hypothetical protein
MPPRVPSRPMKMARLRVRCGGGLRSCITCSQSLPGLGDGVECSGGLGLGLGLDLGLGLGRGLGDAAGGCGAAVARGAGGGGS